MHLKVFVATTRTQGHRHNDFTYTDGPELVDLAMSCDSDRGDPDGPCGCTRAFTGLDSRKGTTTAEVAARDLTIVQYRNLFHRHLVTIGAGDTPTVRREAAQAADEMAQFAADWPIGTVVERRGDTIVVRAWPTSTANGRQTRGPSIPASRWVATTARALQHRHHPGPPLSRGSRSVPIAPTDSSISATADLRGSRCTPSRARVRPLRQRQAPDAGVDHSRQGQHVDPTAKESVVGWDHRQRPDPVPVAGSRTRGRFSARIGRGSAMSGPPTEADATQSSPVNPRHRGGTPL